MRLWLALTLLCLPLRSAWAVAMQITNISDLTVPSWGIDDPAISQSMDICIYGLNVPSLTSYAITVSSTPAGYKISNGSQTIPFTLFWDDSGAGNLGSGGATQLNDGVKLGSQMNLNILLTNCGGAPNARLTMKITQANMTAALAGTYTGTITLLLTPN